MKTAVLIQAHSNIDHFIDMFNSNKNVNFYVHMDKKNKELNKDLRVWGFENVYVVENSVKVYWGGYSQLIATLILIKLAYQNPENIYFHLISGECVPLVNFEDMMKEWIRNDNCLYMNFSTRDDLNWRLNIKAPHSDTFLLRTFIGRVFNRALKILGNRFKFTKFHVRDYAFGSQWFSFTRYHASLIIEYDENNYFENFRKISCADEHAFQMLFKKLNIKISDNKRYIVFKDGKSSPEYLKISDLQQAESNGLWFARKVNKNTFREYLKHGI